MQNQPQEQQQVKAVILLQIDHVFMHRLLKKEKTLFTSGTCKVAKLDSGRPNPAYFINIGSFYYGIHQNIYFIKVVYQDTISYVFPHFENGLSAISLLADSPSIANFEEIISNAARLIIYPAAMEEGEIRATIEEHYPNLEKQQIYYPDNIKKIITTSGKFFNNAFTTMGGYLKTGVEKAGNYLNSKIEQGEPTQLKPETKERWESLKNGTTKVFQVSAEYANKILTPVFDKTREYTNDIKTKIDRSENQKIKYAKELVQVSGRAIEQAFDGLLKSGTEVTKEIGEQSKKMITKKYGDDVIKTLTSERSEIPAENAPDLKEQHEHQHSPPATEESQVRLEQSKEELYPSLEK